MATIELKDITKEYRSDEIITPALKNISLKIGTGEFVAIMGASGSGKTTLLNIIGCMDVPTSGTYLLDNEDLGGAKEKTLIFHSRQKNIICLSKLCPYRGLYRIGKCRSPIDKAAAIKS